MSSLTEAPPFERPRCSDLDCNRFAPAIFKPVPGEPESYVYLECDRCGEYVCRSHALEEVDEIVCDLCYQAQAMRRAHA